MKDAHGHVFTTVLESVRTRILQNNRARSLTIHVYKKQLSRKQSGAQMSKLYLLGQRDYQLSIWDCLYTMGTANHMFICCALPIITCICSQPTERLSGCHVSWRSWVRILLQAAHLFSLKIDHLLCLAFLHVHTCVYSQNYDSTCMQLSWKQSGAQQVIIHSDCQNLLYKCCPAYHGVLCPD